jgi:uncharacterized membrane protein HdeD (DUF308 family)
MRIALAKNWWALIVRGLVAIAVGVTTFVWPQITITALVMLFGAYALIDGVVSLIGAWQAVERRERWGALLIEGIAGIAAAVVTILWPPATALALVYLVAAWALVTGTSEIVAAVRLRHYVEGEWLLLMSGIASILLGALMIIAPFAGMLAITLWIGAYAVVSGVLLIALGIRLRRLAGTPSEAIT